MLWENLNCRSKASLQNGRAIATAVTSLFFFFENSIRNLVLVANSSSDSAARKCYERGKNLDDTIVPTLSIESNLKHNTVPAYTLVFFKILSFNDTSSFVPRENETKQLYFTLKIDRSLPPLPNLFLLFPRSILFYLLTYLNNDT